MTWKREVYRDMIEVLGSKVLRARVIQVRV